MVLFFIVSMMFALAGIFHTIQIVWTRTHRKQILAKYKPASLAYTASLKFLNPKRLLLTILGTIIAIVCTVASARSILRMDGGIGVLVVGAAIAAIVMSASLGYAHSFLYKNKN